MGIGGGGGCGAGHEFLRSHGAVGADLAGCESLNGGAGAENETLRISISRGVSFLGEGKGRKLTAKIFATPMISTRQPEEMTIRQNGVPRDFSDVASLLRFPRIQTPRTIIKAPRVIKPESWERRGQLRAM